MYLLIGDDVRELNGDALAKLSVAELGALLLVTALLSGEDTEERITRVDCTEALASLQERGIVNVQAGGVLEVNLAPLGRIPIS